MRPAMRAAVRGCGAAANVTTTTRALLPGCHHHYLGLQQSRRSAHARAQAVSTSSATTTTTVTTTQRPPSSAEQTPELSMIGAPPTTNTAATNMRLLPTNIAPATRYTVDDVAAADAARFRLDPSVTFWRGVGTRFGRFYDTPQPSAAAPATAADGADTVGLQELEELPAVVGGLVASAIAAGDTRAAAYWTYHAARTTFFLGVAATGAVTHHLAYSTQQLLQSLGLSAGGSSSSSSSGGRQPTPFDNLSANARAELLSRLREALAVYRQDLQAVQEGHYKLPYDMTTLTHRQYNPLFAARMTAAFAGEAVATLNRRMQNDTAPTANWMSSPLHPDYYEASTFHHQSDGWLSSRSADVYETSTEALFFGRQDAMQRAALLPLSKWIRAGGLDPASIRLAEVGCGTGRFHTFIKDNWPEMQTIASDLSPFYLARARDNLSYWRNQRAPGADLGGTDGTGVTYIQAAMERLPLPDASLDCLMSVYAFHEMPETARAAAAAEFFRVLKPGGLVVLADSVQLGDRPAWDPTLGAFGNMNEPHFRSYIACDLGSLFADAGFTCEDKVVCSATKSLSFTKPANGQFASSSGSSDGVAGAEELSSTEAQGLVGYSPN